MRKRHDIAVIGAGPVGCVAAIAFGQAGKRVLLLEANPRAADRFAGEWIHPSGVAVLEKYGLDRLDALTANGPRHGFVAHPDDGSEPIVLPYPDDMKGVSFEHGELVRDLRREAQTYAEIDYVAPARLTRLKPVPAYKDGATGAEVEIDAARIVAADGRRSGTRRMLGLADCSTGLSYMAGLIVKDVALPVENFGHVLNGPAGPIMIYRIGPDSVRMCLDIPAHAVSLRRDPQALLDAVAPVLPPQLARAMAKSLAQSKPEWIETRFQSRTEYGEGNVALVGDAAGCTHPLTAAGISLGLMDVAALADSADVAAYARRRRAGSRVPEMLSNALYEVYTDHRFDGVAIRRSMYAAWRRSALERRRTMGMLAATETRGRSFSASFFRIGLQAALATVGSDMRGRRWRQAGQGVSRFAAWSAWPIAGLIPGYRKSSTHRSGRVA